MEEYYMVVSKVWVSVALVGALTLLLIWLYRKLFEEPQRLRSIIWQQGIRGPRPTFILGNILEIQRAISDVEANHILESPPKTHDINDSLFPFLKGWRNTYGNVYMFSMGHTPVILLNQPHLVKEITTSVSLDLGRPTSLQLVLGNGILTSNGSVWAHERKVIAPGLYVDKVKEIINLLVETASTVTKTWKRRVCDNGGVLEINIDEDLYSFSTNVLLRACFGSNYSKGEKQFKLLRELNKARSHKWFNYIPGTRYLPTKSNRNLWALEKEVRKLILKSVKEREECKHNEKDLLQTMLEGARCSDLTGEAIDDFVVNNIDHIYQAGFEASATTAMWCLMLLASNQEWQERVYLEVLEVCGSQNITADMLNKMKQLLMVIYESVRLYPPVALTGRELFKDMRFGEINIPKGANIWIWIAALHTDPEIWGHDSYNFNPERFTNGIANSCPYPHVYMPFGFGSRICPGQHLAITELKILLALIISKFSFTLSPNYVHCPIFQTVTRPKYGVVLLLKERP